MKQTAVDYIRQHFIMDEEFEKLFDQAKQMEKEQIKEAYKIIDLDIQHEDVGEINSEQYYNQTYGEI